MQPKTVSLVYYVQDYTVFEYRTLYRVELVLGIFWFTLLAVADSCQEQETAIIDLD